MTKAINFDSPEQKTNEIQRRSFSGGSGSKISITVDDCKKLCKNTNNLEYLSGYENRIRPYTITDETVDRYGDIVRAKGGVFTNFKKNPVLQFAHDYSMPPIGNAVKVWYDKDQKNVQAWALFFDDRIDSSGRSDLIFRFVSANAMRACSIGFMPLEYNVPQSKEERDKIGLGSGGVEFIKWDLMEFSPCPVPANPAALQDCVKSAYRSEQLMNTLRSGKFSSKDVSILKEYPLFDQEILDAFVKEIGSTIIVNNYEFTEDEYIKSVTESIEKDPDSEAYIKPYKNEHSCRLRKPDEFTEFKRTQRESEGRKYSVIWGKEEDSDKWVEQAYRYNVKTWNEKDAKKHCTEHNGILFEPAVVEEKHVSKISDFNFNVNLDSECITEMHGFLAQCKEVENTVHKLILTLREAAAAGNEVKEQKISLYDLGKEILFNNK